MPVIIIAIIATACMIFAYTSDKIDDLLYEWNPFLSSVGSFLQSHYFLFVAVPFFLAAIFFIRLYQTSPKKRPTKNRNLPKIIKEPKEIKMVKGINDNYFSEEDIAPIDDLDIEQFAQQAAGFFDDPSRYSDFLTGWWHRMRVDRASKAMGALNEYLIKLRETSKSASELQEEIIKNRIIFQYQAQIAVQRLREDWSLERDERKLRKMEIKASMARQKFLKKFYEEIDPKKLSNDDKMFLAMFTEMSSSKSYGTEGASASVQRSDPAEILKAGQQERILEIYLKEKKAEMGIKKAEAKKTKALAEQEQVKAKHERYKFKVDKEDPDV